MDAGKEIDDTPQNSPGLDIATRIDDMQREINALQIHVMKPHQWFKDAAVIVAAASFAFSAATTIFTYKQTQQQQIHDTRVELRGLIERISMLPRQRIEVLTKYLYGSPEQEEAIGSIGQEMNLMATQAADLIDRLPPKEVSPTEYIAVGSALLGNGTYIQKGRMLLTRAMDVATDTIEKAIALRYNARALIRFGSVEEGRAKYREALEVISNSMLLDPDKVYFNSETLLYEAEDEFFVGQCSSGAQLVDEAARKARSVSRPSDVQYDQYVNGRIAALQNLLDRCNHTRSPGVVFPKVKPPIPTPMPQPDLTKAFKLSPSGRY